MSKQFWGVIVVIVLIFVGIFALGGKKSDTGKSSNSTVSASNHVEGKGTTGVTLVEYGDFECPYCQAYAPVVKQVQSQFNDQITFQFRNFPLVNVHRNAFAAARAGEAAGLQGKFWEMHDALYEQSNWQAWSNATDPVPYFQQLASAIGANLTQFKTDYSSSKVNDIVNADMAAGNKLDIQGTPTFFLDGKQVQIANTPDAFAKVINAEIAKKQKTTSTTTTTANP